MDPANNYSVNPDGPGPSNEARAGDYLSAGLANHDRYRHIVVDKSNVYLHNSNPNQTITINRVNKWPGLK